jgi:hypothetical protein
VAALADGEVVWMELTGREISRHRFSSRPHYLHAFRATTFVAAEDGALHWFSSNGAVRGAPRSAGEGVLHVAAAPQVAVSIDGAGRLVFWQGEKPHWDELLPGRPSSVAIAALGPSTACLVPIGPNQVLALNKGKPMKFIDLPVPVERVSFSANGLHAACLGADGALHWVELVALKEWLPAAKLTVLLEQTSIAHGQYTKVRINLENSGDRRAHNVEVRLESALLNQAHEDVERIPVLAARGVHVLSRHVHPTTRGDVPLEVSLRYEDELGAVVSETISKSIRVGAGMDEAGGRYHG